jgi:DNA-binding Lrp family transcriptional regulator
MPQTLDPLDQQLIALLKVNARLPVARLARALGCARSTVQLRLKALEDSGVITGYTVSLARPAATTRIHAIVLIAIDTKQEHTVVEAWRGAMRSTASSRSAAATTCAPC